MLTPRCGNCQKGLKPESVVYVVEPLGHCNPVKPALLCHSCLEKATLLEHFLDLVAHSNDLRLGIREGTLLFTPSYLSQNHHYTGFRPNGGYQYLTLASLVEETWKNLLTTMRG